MIALLLSATLLAQAGGYCPQQTSIFGNVVEVNRNELTLHTSESRIGDIHVLTRGARVNANGLALQPGIYVGAYGCLTPGDRSFRAQELTYSTNANTYNGYRRHTKVIEGRIDSIQSGRFLVDSNNGHGDTWVYSNRGDLRTGELVRVTGTFDPRDSALVASNIDILRP